MADVLPRHYSFVGVIEGWGSSGDIAKADDAFLAITGYTRADFERKPLNWRELTPPKLAYLDEVALRHAMMASPNGGFTPAYQKALTRKDGSRVPVLVVCAFTPAAPKTSDSNGTTGTATTLGKWIAHVVDLSSSLEHSWPGYARGDAPSTPGDPAPAEFRERLIGELVRERTRMSAMLDSTEAVIWAVDRDSRLLAANATFQAVQRLASGRETVVGERLLAPQTSSDLLDEWQEAYKRALKGEHFSTRTILDLPGERLHFENVVSPIVDARRTDGAVVGVAVVAQEVSKRVDIEEALRESEARFRSLATGSPMGVFLADPSGAWLYANPRLASIWDVDVEEMFGEGWRRHIHPADAERVARETTLAVTAGQYLEIEYRIALPSGVERNVHSWMAPIRDAERVTGFVGSVQDETERHAIALRTRQREKMESLGTLAGGIAHDFNNMLAVVFCHTEIAMEEAAPDASFRRSLEAIQTASHRARDLVRQILSFSRMSDLPDEPVDLNVVVSNGVSLLRATLPAAIHLDVRTPPEPVFVTGDASALQQILVNLCTNAANAMRQQGTISVRLQASAAPPNAEAILSVSDTGCGMTPQIQSRIFEPFFTTRRLGEGTGMGLAVVHGVVAAHQGTIAVESAPGAGSTFRISLPLVSGAQDEFVARIPSVPAPRSGRVLLVEDEAGVAYGATLMLNRAGYHVRHATDGIEALQIFSAAPDSVDVILTDLAMPGLPGDKLAQAIHIVRPTLPILLMSGFSEPLRAADLARLGVVGLLPKPWTSTELLESVRLALKSKAAPPKVP